MVSQKWLYTISGVVVVLVVVVVVVVVAPVARGEANPASVL